jgi:hypothetical protein
MPGLGRPTRESVLDRELLAWELRKMGLNHHQIAEQTGISRRGVGKLLERVYDRESERLSRSVAAYIESHEADPLAILGQRGRPPGGCASATSLPTEGGNDAP